MAQKAAKALAARNTIILNRTLYLTTAFHLFFLLFRGLLFRSSFGRRSFIYYLIYSAPSLLIQFWFERIARPQFGSQPGEVKRSGEDLEARGLTEYLWDVLYWTYGCLALAALFGDKAWWAYLGVPAYSIYAAYGAFTGAKSSLAGLTGTAGEGTKPAEASKRQAKLEKRGQRVQYR